MSLRPEAPHPCYAEPAPARVHHHPVGTRPVVAGDVRWSACARLFIVRPHDVAVELPCCSSCRDSFGQPARCPDPLHEPTDLQGSSS